MKTANRTSLQSLMMLLLHCVIAMMISMLLGGLLALLLDRFIDLRLGLFGPTFALSAIFAGYIASARDSSRTGTYTWIVGLLWMAFGIYETMSEWSGYSLAKTPWEFARNNLFTSHPEGEYGMEQIWFTVPAVVLLSYSLGAWLRRCDKTTK